ncbi:SLAM family member 7 [Rhynchonycteris naso]
MPGSPASFILIFLLCQLTGPATSGAPKKLIGAVGGSVTFPLTHSVNQIETIVWNLNTTLLATIQPNTANKPDNVIVIQNHNKIRMEFLPGNYSLRLSKLSKSDSGTYKVQIYSSLPQDHFIQEYGLHVYEHLSKPQITMGLQNNKNGTCVTNLTCSMEQEEEDVTYSWKSLGQTTNESHNGSIFPISWRLGEKDMIFICIARNPISSNFSNPINAWKLCKGDTADQDFTMVLILLCVLLLLSALLLMPIIWRRRRKVAESSEEKKRMDMHQKILSYYTSSEETSAYDTISDLNKTIPEENSANTLYSVVQIPQKMEKPYCLTSPDTPRPFTHENAT